MEKINIAKRTFIDGLHVIKVSISVGYYNLPIDCDTLLLHCKYELDVAANDEEVEESLEARIAIDPLV